MTFFLPASLKGAIESLPPSDPRAGLKPSFDPDGDAGSRRPERRAASAARQPEPRPLRASDIAAYDAYQEREEVRQTARSIRERERLIEKIERLRDVDYNSYMERFSDKLAALQGDS
ncbi:MAG: hypothetical protein WAN43_00590 [Rhodomicrobium sp.]